MFLESMMIRFYRSLVLLAFSCKLFFLLLAILLRIGGAADRRVVSATSARHDPISLAGMQIPLTEDVFTTSVNPIHHQR